MQTLSRPREGGVGEASEREEANLGPHVMPLRETSEVRYAQEGVDIAGVVAIVDEGAFVTRELLARCFSLLDLQPWFDRPVDYSTQDLHVCKKSSCAGSPTWPLNALSVGTVWPTCTTLTPISPLLRRSYADVSRHEIPAKIHKNVTIPRHFLGQRTKDKGSNFF
jgi:hypothetical protein